MAGQGSIHPRLSRKRLHSRSTRYNVSGICPGPECLSSEDKYHYRHFAEPSTAEVGESAKSIDLNHP